MYFGSALCLSATPLVARRAPPTHQASDINTIMASSTTMLDFDAEATRLRAALGLDTDHPGSTHHDMDKLWVDKRTGGAVYVGNETAAKMSVEQFQHFGIAGVVNCTDDMPNFIEGKPGAPSYMRFNVAWHTHVSGNPTNCAKFLGGFFAFVDAALDQGKSVLVHCLAGAHRAGTAGVLLLMHKDGLSAEDGIKAAQALRPIINPTLPFNSGWE